MKYETLSDVKLLHEEGLKSVSFDLESGYHAIALAPEVRKYFCF